MFACIHQVVVDGCWHRLVVSKAVLEDEAEYTVTIAKTSDTSKATLWVEGQCSPHLSSLSFYVLVVCVSPFPHLAEEPVVIVKGLSDQKVDEGDSVTMAIQASKPNAASQWFKDDSPINNERYETTVAETTHSLTIRDAALDDQGEFTVEVGVDASTANLTVQGRSENCHMTGC